MYIAAFENTSAGSPIEWPYYGLGGQMDSAVAYGPRLPDLAFLFTAQSTVTSPVSVADGIAVFSAGSRIYAINATDGSVVVNQSLASAPLYPIIYAHTIIYANASGYVNAMSFGAQKLWYSTKLPAVDDTPLTIDNGYLAFGAGNYIVLMNPQNGGVEAEDSLGPHAQTPSYGHGEYLAVVPGTGSANGHLYSLALNGGALAQLWSYQLGTGTQEFTPAIGSNYIAVSEGGALDALTFGGSLLWRYTTTTEPIVGGPAISGGDIFILKRFSIYNINATTGNTIWHIANIGGQYQNMTPSVTPYDVYVVTNSSLFRAYNTANQSFDINAEMPVASLLSYNQVALAYGRAYVVGGSTVYAYGVCSDQPTDSILAAMARMYIGGQGACANLILNESYKPGNVGIFVNGTYGPDLHLATFNGKSSAIYSVSSHKVNASYSASMWFMVNRGSPIMDIYKSSTNGGIGGGQTPDYGGGWAGPYQGSPSYFSWREDWPSSTQYCNTTAGSIKADSWYNIVVSVSNYNSVTIYINGTMAKSCAFAVSSSGINDPGIGLGVNPTTTFSLANGTIAGVQLYNGALSAGNASRLYYGGIAGMPVHGSNISLIGWWPLEGDGNSYAGTAFANLGYAYNVSYNRVQFLPVSLLNAYQVSKASLPMSLGSGSSLYNVSVVVWR